MALNTIHLNLNIIRLGNFPTSNIQNGQQYTFITSYFLYSIQIYSPRLYCTGSKGSDSSKTESTVKSDKTEKTTKTKKAKPKEPETGNGTYLSLIYLNPL